MPPGVARPLGPSGRHRRTSGQPKALSATLPTGSAGHLNETRTTCCRCGASRKFKTARGAVLELLQSCTHLERKNADALKKFRVPCAPKPLLQRRVSPLL